MRTQHIVYFHPAQDMSVLEDCSINEIVTSPPYPMIEMWDETFSAQNRQITKQLISNNPKEAFELMHSELDKVWRECFRVLSPGGFLCINIGDATRSLNGEFSLYSNHSRIINFCVGIGFTNLPNIIWRKQTNAPNKFMGSGMLPCGAYVTLEHEYILIFRKGGKREFKTENEKELRQKSAYFWEERNSWFSDVWDLKGVKQKINGSTSRERSAAYPLEIPFRLINMYSRINDTILDPFFGLGTTSIAAILSERNSIGFEIDTNLRNSIKSNLSSLNVKDYNSMIQTRFDRHLSFVREREINKGILKHHNTSLSSDVMTSQEEQLELHYITSIEESEEPTVALYAEYEDHSNIKVPPKADGYLF